MGILWDIVMHEMTPQRPTRTNIHKVALVFIPILVVVLVAQVYFFHMAEVYPIQVVSSEYERTLGDMSVSDKVIIMQEALVSLEAFHGNPQFPYPTAWYDIDETKTLIAGTIAEAQTLEALTSTDNFAYQQGIINLNAHVVNNHERIMDHYGAIGFNPFLNPIGYFLMILLFASPILLYAIDEACKKSYEKAYELYSQEGRRY